VISAESKIVAICRLEVCGVVRADVGEADVTDANGATTAMSQSFKRAATQHSVGRFLYALPKAWVPYDSEKRCITPQALAQLQQAACSGGNGASDSSNGDVLIPAGPHAGKPLSWLAANDRPYLERIATDAQDANLREAAQDLLN
jgi:hypothetical protein